MLANKGMIIILLNGFVSALFHGNSTRWGAGAHCSTPLQEWIHIVVTWRPQYGAALYVYGELTATDDTAQPYTVDPLIDEPRFIVGVNSLYNIKLEMALDELRVWDAVINDEDVLALYNGDSGVD